jgi:endonuclease/exonuclease/phosphatase family metal-dependent hydrolase
MTLNAGNGLIRPEKFVRWLQTHGTDIVGIQELDEDQAAALQAGLQAEYPFQVLHGDGFEGRGLLSRYPLLDHNLPYLRPDRFDLHARVATPDAVVSVLVAHPLPPRPTLRGITANPETSRHIDGLSHLALASAPTVILGDFNMTMKNPMYARLREAGLIDAFVASGRGAGRTFPVRPGKMRSINHRMYWVPLPAFTRIDYIWHTPELTSHCCWVGPNNGSDHLPVLAEISLTVTT